MSKTKVKVSPIDIAMQSEIKEILEKAGKDCVELIKQKSPSRSGDYRDGWTYKIEKSGQTVAIYNDGKNKTLTHLLELGHQTKLNNIYKKGRSRVASKTKRKGKAELPPQEHIRPAYNVIKEQYLEDLKNINIRKIFKK